MFLRSQICPPSSVFSIALHTCRYSPVTCQCQVKVVLLKAWKRDGTKIKSESEIITENYLWKQKKPKKENGKRSRSKQVDKETYAFRIFRISKFKLRRSLRPKTKWMLWPFTTCSQTHGYHTCTDITEPRRFKRPWNVMEKSKVYNWRKTYEACRNVSKIGLLPVPPP